MKKPICPSCGKETLTSNYHITGVTGNVIQKVYLTKCNNGWCKDGYRYQGKGETVNKSKADFGEKYDKNMNEIKPTQED